MKKLLLSAGMILMLGATAGAQVKKKARPARSTPPATVHLEQSSSHAAMAPAATRRFTISDPVVNFYNGRVTGSIADEDVDRPIIGMPKLRYGVAHGHLLFYNTTSPTIGGLTGSGSVGTGTSSGNAGSGATTGVNGKNPYSGPGIYGNRVRLSGRPVALPPSPLRDKERPDQRP
jgi:hypothetical protein